MNPTERPRRTSSAVAPPPTAAATPAVNASRSNVAGVPSTRRVMKWRRRPGPSVGGSADGRSARLGAWPAAACAILIKCAPAARTCWPSGSVESFRGGRYVMDPASTSRLGAARVLYHPRERSPRSPTPNRWRIEESLRALSHSGAFPARRSPDTTPSRRGPATGREPGGHGVHYLRPGRGRFVVDLIHLERTRLSRRHRAVGHPRRRPSQGPHCSALVRRQTKSRMARRARRAAR